MPKECEKFFNNPKTPNKVPEEVEEIVLEGKSLDDKIYCYNKENPEDPQYGWCKITGNYYDVDSPDKGQKSWGYCSRDCYLDMKTSDSGVLRQKKNVEILSEGFCNLFLQQSLLERVEVRPKILCVAKSERWKEAVWRKTRKGYQEVTPLHAGVRRYGKSGYVHSLGTCQGDSGGPSFVREGDRFVVTGAVSGGRGILGECGGVNNPVHYVRIKKHTKWILRNLAVEDKKTYMLGCFFYRKNGQTEQEKKIWTKVVIMCF